MKEAVEEIDQTLARSPQDEIARKLKEVFAAKLAGQPQPAELVSDSPSETPAAEAKPTAGQARPAAGEARP
jgi:hypothetical protein